MGWGGGGPTRLSKSSLHPPRVLLPTTEYTDSGQARSFLPVPRLLQQASMMISPRLALSPSFLAFRPGSGSPAASPPPSPRLHAPPPLSASYYSTVATAAPAASSFYDVLGLRPGASAREIKAAYRRLALAVHPDAATDPASSSAEDFIRVHTAYSTLSDPDKRADYDRRLLVLSGAAAGRRAAVALGRSPSFPAHAHRSRRTWETDQCW